MLQAVAFSSNDDVLKKICAQVVRNSVKVCEREDEGFCCLVKIQKEANVFALRIKHEYI